eukprot:3973514-Amphidinium_carterae.1
MGRADTVATLTSGDVGLATLLTLVNEPGSRCLAAIGLKNFRAASAELLAVVRALEECNPRRV